MKRSNGKLSSVLAVILVVAMVVSGISLNNNQAYATDDSFNTQEVNPGEGLYYRTLSDGTLKITGYNKSTLPSDVVIPSEINGKRVTIIGYLAFCDCSDLTSITIPGSVTSIEQAAFMGCNNLTSVTIQNGVTNIGPQAFDGCNSLTSINIPESVTTIDFLAFSGCSSLSSITVDDSSKYYSSSEGVLYNKTKSVLVCYPSGNKREQFDIPKSVTSISSYAFWCSYNLTSIGIPESVTSIENEAFTYCRNLTSITIPGSITAIPFRAFEGCSNLVSATILDGVTGIGDSAFEECEKLTSVIIPESVTSIGKNAFYKCASLTNVIIPDGVTGIGDRTFAYCRKLTSVIIPDGVTGIGDRTFAYCRKLTSVIIPDGVTSIKSCTFRDCDILKSITIPESVISIGKEAFSHCENLKYVYYGSCSRAKYKSINIATDSWDNNYYFKHAKVVYKEHFSLNSTINDDGVKTGICDICGDKFIGDYTVLADNIDVVYNPTMPNVKEMSITDYYSDEFFTYDNTKYHKDLARFSLLVSMAAMSKWTTNMNDRDGHIKDLLTNKLCFDNYKSKKYNVSLDNTDDTVGYAFACKEIAGKKVMAIAIRSGGYGGEWESNGRVCKTSDLSYRMHSGFSSAASDVYQDAKAYAEENSIDKIWICGYSRGAAVSGVLGDMIIQNDLIPSSNLYCYTFEAPQSTKHIRNTRGVYNTISLSDVIPCVPLTKWGFTRYGTNVYIKSTKESLKAYNGSISEVREEFKSITGHKLESNLRLVNEEIVTVLGVAIPNTARYSLVQPEVSKLLGKMGNEADFVNGKKDPYDYSELVDYFNLDLVKCGNVDLGSNGNFLFQQHWPEATYSWLKHGETSQTNAYKVVSFIGSITQYLPFSKSKDTENAEDSKKTTKDYIIRVYDKQDNLVAEIINGDYSSFTDNNPDTSLEVIEGLDGKIQILIPEDDEYRFEFEAAEDMTLSYKVDEKENEGEIKREIQYNEINLSKDDTLVGVLEEGSEIDSDTYNPVLNDSKEILPNVAAEGDALNTVNVEVETVGDGMATGSGSYPDGGMVTLTAIPFDHAKFDGWYENDTLISKTDNISFTAKEGNDRHITAKFVADHTFVHKKIAAGYCKDGSEYDECTVCHAIANKVVLRGYSTYYVKSFRVSRGSKSFTARWTKQSSANQKKFTGYQIQYSRYSNMSSPKYATASKSSRYKKISKLSKKKKYYVRVRTYRTVSGKTYYSKWSSKKAVTTR